MGRSIGIGKYRPFFWYRYRQKSADTLPIPTLKFQHFSLLGMLDLYKQTNVKQTQNIVELYHI